MTSSTIWIHSGRAQLAAEVRPGALDEPALEAPVDVLVRRRRRVRPAAHVRLEPVERGDGDVDTEAVEAHVAISWIQCAERRLDRRRHEPVRAVAPP